MTSLNVNARQLTDETLPATDVWDMAYLRAFVLAKQEELAEGHTTSQYYPFHGVPEEIFEKLNEDGLVGGHMR